MEDNTFHFACEQTAMTIVLCYFDRNIFLVDIIIGGTYGPPRIHATKSSHLRTRKNQSINIRTQKNMQVSYNPESAFDNGNKVTVTFLIMATEFFFFIATLGTFDI